METSSSRTHLEIKMHDAQARMEVFESTDALRHIEPGYFQRHNHTACSWLQLLGRTIYGHGSGCLRSLAKVLDDAEEVPPAAQIHREEKLVPCLERENEAGDAMVACGAHDIALHHD